MSENEIKPVAWMVDEQGMTGDLGTRLYWARNGGTPPSFGQNHSPLYDQSAIDRLTAERDAALVDAERWRHARRLFDYECIEDAQESYESFGRIVSEGACRRADIAIDAARAQEREG